MRTKTRIGMKLVGAGILCLATFGMMMKSSQAATYALSFLGRAFVPDQATCFDSADFGRTTNNGSCGTGGVWYVINPPVTSGTRAVAVTGSSGINGSASTANAVVTSRAGALVRQAGTKNLPGGIGGGTPASTGLSAALAINANEYLEFDFFLMPSGSVNSVVY